MPSNIDTLISVGSLNNNRTVMSCTYAWRPLACMPILKTTAFTNVDKDWQAQRRLGLYHNAMGHIVADVNDLCSKDRYYRFADKIVRCGRGFWHFLSLDGSEIAVQLCVAQTSAQPVSVPRQSWTTLKPRIHFGKPVRLKGRLRLRVPDC